MRTLQEKILVVSVFLSLICALQVESLPVPDDWKTGLIQRTKRSLLWRWNSMKPVGASCREHLECGTKYCRKNICSFWIST
ncbi:liver-expressed antimicrobial peptide 2-like [Centropristis striata]|uniref:liver-expressed antimicrobial peptide 2-like n=1 Tax=Centropristis striata TaxID=184440 RepID=UPI0027DF3830|nr:liver-expressed antimicrobial peptide 2-like [Centropristis striata]